MNSDLDIDAQKEYYDQRWAEEDFADRLKLNRCATILSLVGRIKAENPKILELGCGSGWLTSILGQFGPTTGIELSPAAVEEASKRFAHVKFEQVNLAGWVPATSDYDIVISHEVLEHLENQHEHLLQAQQLLKPGGHLVLTTPNRHTMQALPESRRATWTTQPIENWVTRSQLRTLLRQANFTIEYETSCILGHGDRGIRRILNSHKLNVLIRRLGLGGIFDAMRMKLDYGLHLVVLAKKGG